MTAIGREAEQFIPAPDTGPAPTAPTPPARLSAPFSLGVISHIRNAPGLAVYSCGFPLAAASAPRQELSIWFDRVRLFRFAPLHLPWDLADQAQIFDSGDHAQFATTMGAGLDVDKVS
jgi:hypothetical protein